MNEHEIREWLAAHDITGQNADRFIAEAQTSRTGFTRTVNGVFISWDGQMFNPYVA